jgi:nucleotide-binding universal stress UspA family protein
MPGQVLVALWQVESSARGRAEGRRSSPGRTGWRSLPVKVNKILVPVDGHSTDDDAVQFACGLARRQKARIYVIYVIEVPRTRPLDDEIEPEIEKGERYLDRAERLAAEAESKVETELLQAREVGPAIVDEAVERGVDAVVMGVPSRKRYGEFSIGSTATYVLKNAPCAVWLCREPLADHVKG